MSSGEVQDSFTKFCTTADPPEEKVICFTLKFVIAFVIIGSICLLGMIGNFLSLFVLAKIKVCKRLCCCFVSQWVLFRKFLQNIEQLREK